MASTKAVTVLFDDVTLTAGAGDTTSALATLTDGYGATLNIKFTNGATGPTIEPQAQIEVSEDNSEWYEFGGAMSGAQGNNDVVSWGGISIPIGTQYLRILAGSNTDENVVIAADLSEVTSLG